MIGICSRRCPPASRVHEPKLDGYRLQIVKSGRTVRALHWTKRLWALYMKAAIEEGIETHHKR
jgi:ATP-dependent DNA ligase